MLYYTHINGYCSNVKQGRMLSIGILSKDDGLEFAMFGKAKQQVWLNFGKSNSLKTIKPKGLNKITKLSWVYHEGHDCNSCNYEYII